MIRMPGRIKSPKGQAASTGIFIDAVSETAEGGTRVLLAFEYENGVVRMVLEAAKPEFPGQKLSYIVRRQLQEVLGVLQRARSPGKSQTLLVNDRAPPSATSSPRH